MGTPAARFVGSEAILPAAWLWQPATWARAPRGGAKIPFGGCQNRFGTKSS